MASFRALLYLRSLMGKPRPLVFCGPSGVGKSTLLKKLMDEYGDFFGFSVSHTTRQPRSGEVNGREYHFIARDAMVDSIRNGDFIENAEYSGNLYGTSKRSVEVVRDSGKICVLDIDMQGVILIKQTDLNPLMVFIKPPSVEELKQRLIGRGTETEESLQRRLDIAQKEIEFGEEEGNFDIVIINHEVDKAYEELLNFLLPAIDEIRTGES